MDRLCSQPLDWSRFLGRKKISFFRRHLALGRTGRYSRPMSASSACCGRARCIRTRPASPPPSSCSLAVHRLALERLEEGFRERVVPWVARPRHGLGDSMGLGAALERPGSVLGTLAVVEDEAEALGRALPSDRLLERIRDQLPGHRRIPRSRGSGTRSATATRSRPT